MKRREKKHDCMHRREEKKRVSTRVILSPFSLSRFSFKSSSATHMNRQHTNTSNSSDVDEFTQEELQEFAQAFKVRLHNLP